MGSHPEDRTADWDMVLAFHANPPYADPLCSF